MTYQVTGLRIIEQVPKLHPQGVQSGGGFREQQER